MLHDRSTPRERNRSACYTVALWYLSLVVPVALAVTGDGGPSGYIRIVEGEAHIESAGARKVAQPFVPITIDDVVVVERGRVVVCDIRSAEQFEVLAGQRFALPRKPSRPLASLRAKLQAALAALTEPPQTESAHVRGRHGKIWPNNASFAPAAHIQFRWSSDTVAARFVLFRANPAPQQLFEASHPSNPQPWPSAVPCAPGRYEWHLTDSSGELVFLGHFTMLSEVEAAERRARYAKVARARFGVHHQEIGIELLAAKDQYFLH